MNNITLVYPYYNNRETLKWQVHEWNELLPWMRANLSVRLIDDGSRQDQRPDDVLRTCALPTELYRIEIDKPWNQHAARNLGAYAAHTSDEWMLMTDMDISVPETALCALLQRQLDRRAHYFFDRYFLDGRPNKPHCNTFLVTREHFWAAGGYDERFCGAYGGDGIFTRALERVSARLDLPLELIGLNDVVPNCSTQGLGRKDTEFHRDYIRRRDEHRGAAPITMQFPWHRVW